MPVRNVNPLGATEKAHKTGKNVKDPVWPYGRLGPGGLTPLSVLIPRDFDFLILVFSPCAFSALWKL
jgi:hypothetical protein